MKFHLIFSVPKYLAGLDRSLFVQRVSLRTVDLNFGKKWKRNSKVHLAEGLDLRFALRLLTPELIARESKYLKSLVLYFPI